MSKEVQNKQKITETKTSFCVVYDGPDHKTHDMNIMTLGRALTSLGTVLYEANHVVNGDRNTIKIDVNADFKEGSFGVEVILIQLLANSVDILQVLGFTGAAGAGAGTVVGALKELKGKEITTVQHPDDEDGDVTIIAEGTKITADKDVSKLVTNKTFRAAMEGLISAPLKNAGTTSFAIKRSIDDKPLVKVTKAEENSFSGLIIDIKEQDKTQEKKIKFIAADIKKTTGWKVEIDGQVRTVHMEDALFKERLLNMEEPHIFGKFFIVKMKIKESTRLNKTKKSYTIVRVQHETN